MTINDMNEMEKDADITPEERALLDQSFDDSDSKSENELNRSKLDNVDQDGTPLNEKSSANAASGDDLDVPGSEEDDAMEDIGEEDEENNSYSQADTQ